MEMVTIVPDNLLCFQRSTAKGKHLKLNVQMGKSSRLMQQSMGA